MSDRSPAPVDAAPAIQGEAVVRDPTACMRGRRSS
jgi:hypothetical protein